MVNDILLFPHCDLHMAIAGTPPLKLRLFNRLDGLSPSLPYTLTQVAFDGVDFFAPHNAPRDRLKNLPSVDLNTGLVTAKTPGVYLFQFRAGDQYLVGRLQVHNSIVGWWFGNDSITTAVDPTIFHAQPSIYARFDDDPATGTDLVGDITGHGYVPLTSSDQTKFVTNADGRLRGVTETAGNPALLPQVSGTFLNQNNKLTVRVVDYGRPRTDLTPLFAPTVAHANDKHNVVFLAEGFLEGDSPTFDIAPVEITEDIFHKPRHQPYAMLNGSFNVFSAFAPSQQQAVTCGFRVTDTAVGPIPTGTPIPYENRISADLNLYTMKELVTKVGLPMRREHRPDLNDLWNRQDLHDFVPAKVNDALIAAWKAQQSEGILHARDTFFGLYFGRRLADHPSGIGPVPPPPNGDTAGDAGLQKFIARVYEFYQTGTTRVLTPDPRRHPPELCAPSRTNPNISIIRYLAGLQYRFAPNYPVGQTWVPDDTLFKPSRGLVAMICLDDLDGGDRFNNGTLTAVTVDEKTALHFVYADSGTKLEMRREPGVIEAFFDKATNTIAHEFGHSFNLGDEYEEFDGDDPNGPKVNEDSTFDNLAALSFIRSGQPDSRNIDPNRVKWLGVVRARLSDSLVVASTAVAGGIVVTIDPRFIGKWVRAKADQDSTRFADVNLRNANVTPTGQQLPLQVTTDQILTGLTILDIDETLGTILLSSQALPVPIPTFAKGSSVFLPLRGKNGELVHMADRRVLDFLGANHTPLNLQPDAVHVNGNVDQPLDIAGIGAPRLSPRLVGIYEGAGRFAGGYYRPTGECKMRNGSGLNDAGEFCFVCKWLIVNRVDPGYHSIISSRFYPEATNG